MLQSIIVKNARLWFALKLCIAALAIRFIILKVLHHESSGDYLEQLKMTVLQPGSALLFLIIMILMFFNWLTEAFKWKYMIGKIEDISVGRALEAVFSGLTISFFTPNRIGEFAGRVFHLHSGKRVQATLITVIENCSQLLITILTGSIACIIYIHQYMEISPLMSILMQCLLVIFSIFCILLFFNLDFFESFSGRFRISDYWKNIFHVFSLYSHRELLRVTLLSLLRYVIFSIQFYLLLRLFGFYSGFFPSLVMIAMTFFVMSIVPTFAFTEIGVRGAVSAYFFSKLSIDMLPVLNAAFSLWFINIVLPALAGAIFMFHFRLGRNGK